MKKILCLIDSLGSGGAQRQLVGLAKLLNDNNNYDVKVVWYHNANFYQNFLEENKIKYENIIVKNKFTKFFTIYNSIKNFAPDVVIAYIDGPTIIASIIRMLNHKIKLIVSERNTTQQITLKSKVKFFLYRWADVIVPNSYSQENFIKQNFFSLYPKVKTITNFTDTDYFLPADIVEKRSRIKMLVVGRIVPQKNVLQFVKVVESLQLKKVSVDIDWYGTPYDQEYFDLCISEKDKLGVDSLVFHEPTSDVKSLYQNADVFCLPSLYEGYPNVVCEAMSCGLPILCSNVCDNPNIVEDGINGFLFNPNNVDDIVDKIQQFVSLSHVKRDEMRKRSRQIALEKFSKESFLHKYDCLIKMM